ncbi:MAG: bifunctional oligoribonuclease/PAP phosphatase NrnA [Lachnospiraceae bacterium]|nr:bifunctional oligoribonuclease/PAP phosphatase NrnA [Lachnospiraceae bacterium]
MSELIKAIEAAQVIGISGHRRPDGDCVGACLGIYNYIRDVYPGKEVTIYLESIKKEYRFLRYSDTICHSFTKKKEMDLFLVLDCADMDRLGDYKIYSKKAKTIFNVDHHISNDGFGDKSIVVADASSTCEILFDQLDYDKISKSCAEALYMGIVHDTGVFKHTNTSRKTMHAAGDLIAKGLNTSHIIDDTFYRKSYAQNQILGRALIESIQLMDGKILFSVITKAMLKFYGVTGADLDGIIDQLRMTEGVECAILIYEIGLHKYKISLRSNDYVDVNAVASNFGGGGHVRASGCTMMGLPRDVINNLTLPIAKQMREAGIIEDGEI